jgi:hypothetical protein
MPGFILAVMVAHAGAGGKTIAESSAHLVDRRLMFFCGHVHGCFLLLVAASAMDTT